MLFKKSSLFHIVFLFVFVLFFNKGPWGTTPPHLRTRKSGALLSTWITYLYKQINHVSQRSLPCFHICETTEEILESTEQILGPASINCLLYTLYCMYAHDFFLMLIFISLCRFPTPQEFVSREAVWTVKALSGPLWKKGHQIICKMYFVWK